MDNSRTRTIARTGVEVTRETLAAIFDLISQHKWLKPKSESLASLLSECNCEIETELIVHLLSQFRYFDNYDLNSALDTGIPTVEKEWGLSPGDTVFAALARDNNVDSGAMFLSNARNRLENPEWKKAHFYTKFYEIDFDRDRWIKKLVLCDDFTGTGSTLARKSSWLKKRFSELGIEDLKVYFFGLACMEFAIPAVMAATHTHYFCELLKKGLSDHFEGDRLYELTSAAINMESQLQRKNIKELSLGYKKSESLYNLLDSNIPNNVFPIFWWPKLVGGHLRKRLFRRVS